MSEQRRVVVTGLGIVSPLGNDLDSTWSNIISGKSGAGRITKFDPEDFSTTFAAELKGYDEVSGLSPKEIRRIDPFIQYALTASDQAIKDADLSLDDIEKTRIGVSIGSGIGGLGSIEDNALILRDKSPRKISPFFVPGAILARIGWAMNQALLERGTTSMYDGFWEMIMFFFGIILMYISLSLWPWNSYVEESQS